MSGVHKHPTISFRVSDREREMIEAKILASGMQKKDYFVRSCIYNRICVVGKKEVIYQLVEELQNIRDTLAHDYKIAVNDKRVLRICRKKKIQSYIKHRYNCCTKPASDPAYVAENILNREFKSDMM